MPDPVRWIQKKLAADWRTKEIILLGRRQLYGDSNNEAKWLILEKEAF